MTLAGQLGRERQAPLGGYEAQAALTIRNRTIGRASKEAVDSSSASGVLRASHASTITAHAE